jgi:hypothetical protein
MEAEEADLRDFSELPISVLVSIFDNVGERVTDA